VSKTIQRQGPADTPEEHNSVVAPPFTSDDDATWHDLVDLDSAAFLTGRSRDSLRNHHARGNLPAAVESRGRQPNLYRLSDLAPFLATAGDD
jgi:hypothetical protein